MFYILSKVLYWPIMDKCMEIFKKQQLLVEFLRCCSTLIVWVCGCVVKPGSEQLLFHLFIPPSCLSSSFTSYHLTPHPYSEGCGSGDWWVDLQLGSLSLSNQKVKNNYTFNSVKDIVLLLFKCNQCFYREILLDLVCGIPWDSKISLSRASSKGTHSLRIQMFKFNCVFNNCPKISACGHMVEGQCLALATCFSPLRLHPHSLSFLVFGFP